MAEPKVSFNRGTQGLGRSLPGKDHLSGFITYAASLPTGFGSDKIKKIFSLEEAQNLGITENDATFGVLWYQLREAFRLNPAIVLWVSIQPVPANWGTHTFAEVEELQLFTEGEIRQIAVFAEGEAYSTGHVTAIQAKIDALRAVNMPLQAIYSADFSATTASALGSVDLRTQSDRYVAVCIAQDGSGKGAALATSKAYSVPAIGTQLGLVSKAPVNHSIGWKRLYPISDGVEFAEINLATGESLKDISQTLKDTLFDNGFTTPRRYVGDSQAYFNGTPTAVALTDDFSYQNLGRTMDKAERGVRLFIEPEINSSIVINSDGTISAQSAAFFKDLAEQPLEAMEAAEEISSFTVTIPDTQKPLEADELIINFDIVPTGTARTITINSGFKVNS